MRSAALCPLLLCVSASPCWGAKELGRLLVDLNHDGKAEVVRLDSAPSKESYRAELRISVGRSAYKTSYFAADGDRPDLQVVQLNRSSGLTGLVLTTDEAGGCVRHLLSYVDSTLHLLLKHDAGPSCYSLVTYGDLRFSVSTWEGFWTKTEMYRATPDGKSVGRVPQTEYSVQATGYAGIGLELQGATCGSKLVAPGAYLTVMKFEVNDSRYLLQTPDGACGWIPSSEFTTDSPKIKGLPWAG